MTNELLQIFQSFLLEHPLLQSPFFLLGAKFCFFTNTLALKAQHCIGNLFWVIALEERCRFSLLFPVLAGINATENNGS